MLETSPCLQLRQAFIHMDFYIGQMVLARVRSRSWQGEGHKLVTIVVADSTLTLIFTFVKSDEFFKTATQRLLMI